MSDLTQLYQDIILGHNKRPKNYGPLDNYSGKAEKNNPLCGDEVTVFWTLQDEHIAALQFTSQGCAISRASASIMTDLLKGKTPDQVKQLFEDFRSLLQSPEEDQAPASDLGELVALSGVRQYPSRIKCALLAWEALLEKLDPA